MEPLVVFGALLVVYCGYWAAVDAVRDWQIRKPATRGNTVRQAQRQRRDHPRHRPRTDHGVMPGRLLAHRTGY